MYCDLFLQTIIATPVAIVINSGTAVSSDWSFVMSKPAMLNWSAPRKATTNPPHAILLCFSSFVLHATVSVSCFTS